MPRLGVEYFYYACRNSDCGLRIAADELEGAVLGRLQVLATDPALVERLTEEANRRLQRQLPALSKRRASQVKLLAAVQSEADRGLSEWGSLTDAQAKSFATDALRGLAQQRDDLEAGIAQAEAELAAVQAAEVSAEAVRAALASFNEVYSACSPTSERSSYGWCWTAPRSLNAVSHWRSGAASKARRPPPKA